MTSLFTIEKKNSPEKIPRWNARLLATLRWREFQAYNGSKNWNMFLNMDKGKHWSKSSSDDPKSADDVSPFVTVNKTTSTIESFAAFYLRRLPEFLITQTIEGAERAVSAANQTKILNYYWRELKMNRQFKKSLRFFLDIGHGIIKTGWETELNPGAKINDGKVIISDYIRSENPWITAVDPRRFVFDSEASDYTLDTARWCAEMFIEPIQNVLVNPAYDENVKTRLMNGDLKFESALSVINTFNISITEDQKEQFNKLTSQQIRAEELVIKWEIWDKKFNERIILLQGCEEALLIKDNPMDHLDGFPYLMYKFMPDMPVHYSPGIPYLIRYQAFESDRVRTKQYNHHRNISRKYAVNSDYVDKKELDKLTTGETEFLVHNDPQNNPITAIPDLPMSIDTDRMLSVIDRDWAEITGSDALARSGPLPSRTTATEVNARENFFGVKAEAKADIVSEALQDTGSQIMQHTQKFAKKDIVGAILGRDFQPPVFINVTPDQIKGEFGIQVNSVSADVIDPVLDRSQSIQLIQLFMSNLPLIAQNPILALPFSWLAKKLNAVGADVWLDPILAGLLPNDGSVGATQQQQLGTVEEGGNGAINEPPVTSAQSENTEQPVNEILGALLGGQ